MKTFLAILPLIGMQIYALWFTYVNEQDLRRLAESCLELEKRIRAIEDQNNNWKKFNAASDWEKRGWTPKS